MPGVARTFIVAAMLTATAAGAQTVYKSTGPDGSVVYSDKPPADGKVDRIIELPDMPSSPLPPLAPGGPVISGSPSRAVTMMHTPHGARVVPFGSQEPVMPPLSSHVDVDAPARPAVRSPPPPVTLYSAVWCGYCRRAKAYLADHHIAYLNVDIDTTDGRNAFVNVGKGGIPLLTSGRKRVTGFKEDGYDAFFASR